MEQKWVLYKSALATQREDKTLSKKLLGESTGSAKKAKKLMLQPFFCEEDAKEALKNFKSKHPLVELENETLHVKPKFKTKGRPKPNQEPSHYEYYWQFAITMPKETFVNQSEEACGYFILSSNNLTLTPEELLLFYNQIQYK